MSINDNDGFYIGNNGRSKNRYWLLQDPKTGDYTDLIPDSIHPNELIDDDEQQSVEVRDLANACLRACDIAVIGIDKRINAPSVFVSSTARKVRQQSCG